MSFSENISNKLTYIITHELDYEEEKKEIIAYAIETVLLDILGTVIIVLLGYALNVLVPTVLVACFGCLLRKVSGGAHFGDPISCMVFGAIAYCAIGTIAGRLIAHDFSKAYLIFFLTVSMLIVSFLSPVDSEAKPIHSQTFKLKLKVSSIAFVMVSLLIVGFSSNKTLSISAASGVFYQSITLLPIFNKKGGVYNL
ncbi:accessory gene regulator ArgB-like protein [Desulfosporosinus sp. SB140]|uniref:accessory gene regulator ArgB-like protein n=1 Tax=Desulfosporosinus paludis TaxID=3115649 RepID=UPI003890EFF1